MQKKPTSGKDLFGLSTNFLSNISSIDPFIKYFLHNIISAVSLIYNINVSNHKNSLVQ